MKKQTIVIGVTLSAIAIFVVAALIYKGKTESTIPRTPYQGALNQESIPAGKKVENDTLVRSHSPVIGPENAPVTIVEFLDPSCESCRAFFPIVENILEQYPDDVRLVIRYAPFHQGSDEAVAILEAARKQDLFLPVLTVLFERQPEWAIHGAPNLNKAWELAAESGMDIEKGRQDSQDPAIAALLKQDVEDINANNVRGTPTFFINGNRLASFGQRQLIDAVNSELEYIDK